MQRCKLTLRQTWHFPITPADDEAAVPAFFESLLGPTVALLGPAVLSGTAFVLSLPPCTLLLDPATAFVPPDLSHPAGMPEAYGEYRFLAERSLFSPIFRGALSFDCEPKTCGQASSVRVNSSHLSGKKIQSLAQAGAIARKESLLTFCTPCCGLMIVWWQTSFMLVNLPHSDIWSCCGNPCQLRSASDRRVAGWQGTYTLSLLKPLLSPRRHHLQRWSVAFYRTIPGSHCAPGNIVSAGQPCGIHV